MLNKGQAPKANVGYAEGTVQNRSYRLDRFYRWVWEVEDGYTENITPSHANAFMKYLQPQSYSQAYKAAFQKAITTLFRWQKHDLGRDVDWDPAIRFYDSVVPSSKEALTRGTPGAPRSCTSVRVSSALQFGNTQPAHSLEAVSGSAVREANGRGDEAGLQAGK